MCIQFFGHLCVSLFRHSFLSSGQGSPKQYLTSNTIYCVDYDQHFNKIYVKENLWREPLKTWGKSDWAGVPPCYTIWSWRQTWPLFSKSMGPECIRKGRDQSGSLGTMLVDSSCLCLPCQQWPGPDFSQHFSPQPRWMLISWEHIKCLLLLK